MINLQIKPPIGITLLRALLVIFLLIASSEFILRTTPLERHLHYPGIDSLNPAFEMKVYDLDKLEGIDCIFFGNSMVYYGIDTAIIREETGKNCFNFGVPGLKAEAAYTLACFLIERYDPTLLVFGTAARDYTGGSGNELDDEIVGNPLVRYQLGDFNFNGWLITHLKTYRYYLRYRNWMTSDFSGQLKTFEQNQTVKPETLINVQNPPDPQREVEGFMHFDRYTLLPQHLRALEKMIALSQQTDTRLIILEMPAHPSYFGYFDNGEADHQKFIESIGEIARKNDVLFWTSTDKNLIPDGSWRDRLHLQPGGAVVFSRWVAEHLKGNS